MLYTSEEKEKLKGLLYRLYPEVDSYLENTVTPLVQKSDKGTQVTILILGTPDMISEFIKAPGVETEVEINIATEPNSYGIGRDLLMRFDFYYPTGHPIYHLAITGDEVEVQKEFVQALKEIDTIIIWVVGYEDKEVIEIMEVDFDAEEYKNQLSVLG